MQLNYKVTCLKLAEGLGQALTGAYWFEQGDKKSNLGDDVALAIEALLGKHSEDGWELACISVASMGGGLPDRHATGYIVVLKKSG
ncbi:MAG: hypothetical protein IT307_14035 [Chloroflexi bacterium]|nr:hypothetical protein [Chloroflexota bacterium]